MDLLKLSLERKLYINNVNALLRKQSGIKEKVKEKMRTRAIHRLHRSFYLKILHVNDLSEEKNVRRTTFFPIIIFFFEKLLETDLHAL